MFATENLDLLSYIYANSFRLFSICPMPILKPRGGGGRGSEKIGLPDQYNNND